MMKNKKLKLALTTAFVGYLTQMNNVAYANDVGGDIQGRLTTAFTGLQAVLTSLVVIVGVTVSLFIIIKRMPSADDPQEKNEVYKAVGRVMGLVAIAAACVWVIPWVYALFT